MALKRITKPSEVTPEPAAQAPQPTIAKPRAPVAAAETVAEVAAPEPVAAPPPAKRTAAPAPAVSTSIAPGTFVPLWEDKRDLYRAKFGELPRLKASNGNVLDPDDKVLGDWIELQILSFNSNFVVGPCNSNAPNNLVRYSYDGVEIADGTGDTVAQWITDLKDNNWEDAASKEYYEIVGYLRASAKPSEHVGSMVQIQLSPTSVTAFEGYRKQAAFQVALGKATAETADFVRFETKLVTANSNTWTKLVPKASQM